MLFHFFVFNAFIYEFFLFWNIINNMDPYKKEKKVKQKVEQVEQARGNRNSSLKPTKQGIQCKNMVFTWNNWKIEQKSKLLEFLKENSISWIVGEEVGENGTPHLQGAFILTKKKRFSEIFSALNGEKFHLEKMKGSWEDNLVYCSKDGVYETNCLIKKQYTGDDIIKKETFYPYQNMIMEMIDHTADNRTINWFFDRTGNIGKSAITKYMCFFHKVIVISKGKYSDIMNYLFTINSEFDTVIFDLPRNNGNNISYDAIESIKNGLIFNTKYETGQKLFKPPHVIVFANEKPDINKLSIDRWRIYEIDSETKIANLLAIE